MASGRSAIIKVAFLAYFVYFVFIHSPKKFFYAGFNRVPIPQGQANQEIIPEYLTKKTIKYACSNIKCHGWLYTPKNNTNLMNKEKEFPIIIMAHGLGATKEMGLYLFAHEFAKNGYAVFVFDYRYFGESEGLPRHYIHGPSHVNDYLDTIQYVKRLEGIDSKRICLWGSSYSGGHVLVAASKNSKDIKAVISQMPFLGALKSESKFDELKKRGFINVLIGFYGYIAGNFRYLLNNKDELYLKLFSSKKGKEFALNYWENVGATEQEWVNKHPKQRNDDFRNGFLIRGLLGLLTYKPIDSIDKISSNIKVLYIIAERDVICPNNRIEFAAKNTKNAELIRVDSGHFTIYSGKAFDVSIQSQLKFLNNNL